MNKWVIPVRVGDGFLSRRKTCQRQAKCGVGISLFVWWQIMWCGHDHEDHDDDDHVACYPVGPMTARGCSWMGGGPVVHVGVQDRCNRWQRWSDSL